MSEGYLRLSSLETNGQDSDSLEMYKGGIVDGGVVIKMNALPSSNTVYVMAVGL